VKWWKPVIASIVSGTATSVLSAYLISRVVQKKIKETLEKLPPYRVEGPLVSVIIPTLEEEDFLPRLLKSISHQSYFPIEVVIADSSPSPSREKIKSLAESFSAKYIYVPLLNLPHARNKGAEASSGEILLFCDADVVLTFDYVEKLVRALMEGMVLAHGSDPIVEDSHFVPFVIIGRKWLKPPWYTTGRGVALWREVFFEIGGYDETLDPASGAREDLDLGRRIKDRFGISRMKFVPDVFAAESPRRFRALGRYHWRKVRGVRDRILLK